MNRQEKIDFMRRTIKDTKSKFYSVEFVKKDNTIRHMVCQNNVTKHLKTGKPSTTSHIDKYLTVYEGATNSYKNVNLETLLTFKCGDVNISFKD